MTVPSALVHTTGEDALFGARKPIDLRQLIERCCNPGEPYYESSWSAFYDRYNDFIYTQVRLNCKRWNARKLNQQLPEVVNDVQAEVYAILVVKLGSVLYKDDERRFLAWLKTICRHTTRHFIKRYFINLTEIDDLDKLIHYIKGLDNECAWEYYEGIVKVCRQSSNRKNLERDLAIFQLRVFADFSEAMVRSHPCFSDLGDRIVQLAVARIRELLRENRDSLQ